MLPVAKNHTTAQSTQKELRGRAAREAFDELAVWIDTKRPKLKMSVGNLPRLWSAWALGGGIEQHVVEERQCAAKLLPTADEFTKKGTAARLEALEHFYKTYKDKLNDRGPA